MSVKKDPSSVFDSLLDLASKSTLVTADQNGKIYLGTSENHFESKALVHVNGQNTRPRKIHSKRIPEKQISPVPGGNVAELSMCENFFCKIFFIKFLRMPRGIRIKRFSVPLLVFYVPELAV